ncbi:MAG TPA: metallopeptidase family protein [Bryobacteraceae bacterium]|nr:metallopeptidase family protein [Bryobacteraceae bacterium]
MPLRLAPKAFDAIVERAVANIPGRFRVRMQNLVIVVQPVGPSPDLLGLYEGRPVTARSMADAGEGPDRIRIFQRPHEEMARSHAELTRIVTDTVWHEVGHYFGLSEREINAAEDRRERLRPFRRAARLAKTPRNR